MNYIYLVHVNNLVLLMLEIQLVRIQSGKQTHRQKTESGLLQSNAGVLCWQNRKNMSGLEI